MRRASFTTSPPTTRQKLGPRVSRLTIAVAIQIPALAIRRGGELVESLAWDHALPVDGGTYTITASAPGRIAFTGTVEVPAEAGTVTITVPELAPAPIVVPPLPPPPLPPPPASRLPYVLGGTALVLLGGALAFDLWGSSTYDVAKGEVDNARQTRLVSDANHERYAAEGCLVAGLGVASFAVYIYVRERREPAIAPVIGPRSVGVALRF